VPAEAARNESEPRHILVRGVNWLGDAVMTTPAMQRLCQRFPHAQVTLLTNEKLAQLWQQYPGLTAIETFNDRDHPWSVARRLRSRRFDVALILPNSPRSALEAWLSRIPRRVGYAAPTRSWLLTEAVRPPEARPRKRSIREVKRAIQSGRQTTSNAEPGLRVHQLYHYLELGAVLGCDPTPVAPRLQISLDEIRAVAASFGSLCNLGSAASSDLPAVWLGLNLSAAYGPAKKWPLERFAAVVRDTSRQMPHCRWLNFGTASDWELGENLAASSGAPVVNLAGKTSLRQLMALLASCRVLLSNDSGPMHLAAALGVPVVVPFGSTSPELTGPGLPGDPRHHILRGDAPCSPCFRRTCPIDFRCMTSIDGASVVRAILASLGRT